MLNNKSIFEDYKQILSENGYIKTDFEESEIDVSIHKPNTIYPKEAKTTIKNIKTRKQKTYQSGSGTAWLVEFEQDIKEGYFD